MNDNSYKILKSRIENGTWTVSVMEKAIGDAANWGDISNEQRQELHDLIFQYKKPETELPELQTLYERSLQEVSDLEKRVAKLEGEEEPEPDPGEIVIPEWKAYDAVLNLGYDYQDVVKHGEKYWQNMLQGQKNTWEPGSVGVDERYWKEIKEEEAKRIVQEQQGSEQLSGMS